MRIREIYCISHPHYFLCNTHTMFLSLHRWWITIVLSVVLLIEIAFLAYSLEFSYIQSEASQHSWYLQWAASTHHPFSQERRKTAPEIRKYAPTIHDSWIILILPLLFGFFRRWNYFMVGIYSHIIYLWRRYIYVCDFRSLIYRYTMRSYRDRDRYILYN